MSSAYRYPGSRPFTGDHARVFFGREDDIARLSTLVSVERCVVLFGRSGLGKSSLLNAGLVPVLEEDGDHLIVPIRLGAASADTTMHPLDIVEEELQRLVPDQSFVFSVEPHDVTLWELVKNIEQAHPEKKSILLIFDQFEELFTYQDGIEDFAEAVGSLLYNRIPKVFDRALRIASERSPDLLTEEQWEFLRHPVNVKVLMSIRSDKMSLLNGIADEIPTILHTCYELRSLDREQATAAIVQPAALEGDFISAPFTFKPEAIRKILDFLTQDGRKQIETFQLQIFCEYAEQNVVVDRGDTYVEPEDLGSLDAIYEGYYDTCVRKVAGDDDDREIREFIEEGLIFEDEERRISLFEGQIQRRFDISNEQIRKLVDTHLIRAEPHASGGFLYEVSHDTLVGPILKAKARRRSEEAERERRAAEERRIERRRRKMVRAAGLVGLPILFFVGSAVAYGLAHRDDLDAPGLPRGTRLATTFDARTSDPGLATVTVSQRVGEALLTVVGGRIGTDTLEVRSGAGEPLRRIPLEVVDSRVSVVRSRSDVVPVQVRDPVSGALVPDTAQWRSICLSDRCEIGNRGEAASALALLPPPAASTPGARAQVHVPVGFKLDEQLGGRTDTVVARWRQGLAQPTVTSPDLRAFPDSALVEALVAVAKLLDFRIADNTSTFWVVPVTVDLAPRPGPGEDGITVGVEEEATLNLAVRSVEIDHLDAATVGSFAGTGPAGIARAGAPTRQVSAEGDGRDGVDPAGLLFGTLRAGTLPGVGESADAPVVTNVLSPDGRLLWKAVPGAPWTLEGPDGEVLASGSDSTAVALARSSPDGRLLVATTADRRIYGVPYTVTSFADANRVTVDLGMDGSPDTTFALGAGEHALLQDSSWAGRPIGITATSPVSVVETTRYWWQQITEATHARAVRPLDAASDRGGPWEYWVPYVDTVSGPNGGSSTVNVLAGFDGTTVELDFEHDGRPDSVVTLDRGAAWTVSVDAPGAVLRSDRPLSVHYEYVLTDWGTYEDGWLLYEIPPVHLLASEYRVSGGASVIRVLAVEDGTAIRLDGNAVATLDRGESRTVPSSRNETVHIQSDRPVMVVSASFADDRHGSTYAYVAAPARDTVFHPPPVSPHHYPSSVDRSRVEIIPAQDDTRVSCGSGPDTILNAGELYSCTGWGGSPLRTSRPVHVVLLSEVEGRDSYTGEKRVYAYAHPVMGPTDAGTTYALQPFTGTAVEGYTGGTSELTLLDAQGRAVDATATDGRVLETAVAGRGSFRVVVRDADDRLAVLTIGGGAREGTRMELGRAHWATLDRAGRHVFALRDDRVATWRDLVTGAVDTIRCVGGSTASAACAEISVEEAWHSVHLGADGRLLLAVQRDGGGVLWATECLMDEACRALRGPVMTLEDAGVLGHPDSAAVALSGDGRYVISIRSPVEARLWDINLAIPGAWSFDRVLLWINAPILAVLLLLVLLAPPALFYELISGHSWVASLRRRAESGETGLRATIGRWLS